MKYVVSRGALETMEHECRRSADTETGGILVGFKDVRYVTVTHATGPGPNSQKSATHFVKDTPYLQSVLNLLFQYYQVNYLGVWHKHPDGMPFPSSGDVFSAMDEVGDSQMGMDELIAPICTMAQGKVDVHPFVIKDNCYTRIRWDLVPHHMLPSERALDAQWYATAAGMRRLGEEMARFDELGVKVELRKGRDDGYRFYAPLGSKSPLSLVISCQREYPVVPPEIAVYDGDSQGYRSAASALLDRWSIDRFLADVYKEFQAVSVDR